MRHGSPLALLLVTLAACEPTARESERPAKRSADVPARVGSETAPATPSPPPPVDASLADVAAGEDGAAAASDGASTIDAASGSDASGAAAGDGGDPAYDAYTNTKWGFSIEYPIAFSKKLASGPGQRFLWDQKADLYAWGAHYTDIPIAQLYADWTRRPTLTFKELKGNTFVVRGKEDGKLLYSKSVLADGILVTIELHYAPSLETEMEPVISHVADSLKLEPLGFRKKKP